jgi:hypothetical protein
MEYTSFMPRQTLPEAQKDTKWYQECVNSCMSLVYSYDTTRRSSKYDKKINYDLYSGVFHKEDLKYVTNPIGFADESLLPAELKHYDIVTPIFNLLIGEESQRLFNYMVRVVDESSVSNKQEKMHEQFVNFIMQRLTTGPEVDPNTGQPVQDEKAVARYQKYLRYNYKDMREVVASKILSYLIKKEDIQAKFLKGFEDALVASEELYRVDIMGQEPTLVRVNPLELFFMLPHNSDFIDDADVIVEHTWMSVGQIVDLWHEELTTEQIYFLERGVTSMSGGSADGMNYETPRTIFTADIPEVDSIRDIAVGYNYYANNRGNIRVIKAVWKSKRKIGIIKYLDETGEEYERVTVDETYKPLPGEKVEWKWINEYRECTKIGNDIYVQMQPCRVQRRNMTNLSECKSPYVGTIYNATNAKAVSLMDRLKPYQYLYNIIYYRTEMALAKSIGKVAEFDVAAIPKELGVEKWLYYLQAMNIAFKNSFEESAKGEKLGMMSNNTGSKALDLEQGAYINMHIELLKYIETKTEELSGVTRQRKGQTMSSELVGNVQTSVTQSSLITEKWFEIHNQTKRRALEALVDVAREAYKDKKVKCIQYVLDDMSTEMLKFEGAEFNSAEYGLFMGNSTRDNKVYSDLTNLTQIGLNSDKLNFTQVIDILMSDSISETRRKIEGFEEERNAQTQQAQQLQQQEMEQAKQLQMQQLQQTMSLREKELELQQYKVDSDNETRIRVAEIGVFSRQQDLDLNQNNIPDPIEIANIAMQERQLSSDIFDKQTDQSLKAAEHNHKKTIEARKAKLEEDKLALEKMKMKSDEKIEALKARTALQVAKANKNKYDTNKPKK